MVKAVLLLDSAVDAERLMAGLRNRPGVLSAELLEGPPDAIVLMGAADRSHLAAYVNDLLADIDTLVTGFNLLPVKDTRYSPVR